MERKRLMKYKEYRIKLRYEILLASFILLLFGDIFFGPEIDPMPFLIYQNVIASAFIFYGKKNWRLPYLFFITFLFAVELLDFAIGIPRVRLVFSSIYIIYFIVLSIEVYRQILSTKDVDAGMISAVLCGFMILGMIGGSVFSMIELANPHSYNNIAEGIGGFSDLMYFSFITILSIGYGDITPASDIAQKMAMFFGLIGYFYGVVVIGIIMGKYLSKN